MQSTSGQGVKNGPQYPAYFQAKYKPNKDPLILACRNDQNNNVSTCINSLLVRFFVMKPGLPGSRHRSKIVGETGVFAENLQCKSERRTPAPVEFGFSSGRQCVVVQS